MIRDRLKRVHQRVSGLVGPQFLFLYAHLPSWAFHPLPPTPSLPPHSILGRFKRCWKPLRFDSVWNVGMHQVLPLGRVGGWAVIRWHIFKNLCVRLRARVYVCLCVWTYIMQSEFLVSKEVRQELTEHQLNADGH